MTTTRPTLLSKKSFVSVPPFVRAGAMDVEMRVSMCETSFTNIEQHERCASRQCEMCNSWDGGSKRRRRVVGQAEEFKLWKAAVALDPTDSGGRILEGRASRVHIVSSGQPIYLFTCNSGQKLWVHEMELIPPPELKL